MTKVFVHERPNGERRTITAQESNAMLITGKYVIRADSKMLRIIRNLDERDTSVVNHSAIYRGRPSMECANAKFMG